MLVAAILPAVLVAGALAAILLDRQYRSLDDALQARARAYARQLGSAAEFGIFAGNREALQLLARATQAGDADIVAVSILDLHGQPLAASGATTFTGTPAIGWEEQAFQKADVTVVLSPIRGARLLVDDLYSGGEEVTSTSADGYVVIEMSRQRLNAERNRQLLIGTVIAIAGAMLGVWLALGIAGGVIRTILHIRDVVDRIGKGDLAARVKPDPAGVMPTLEAGINGMAERIGSAQDFLIQRIEEATAELRERKEEAERANAAKTRFVAAASHDLRQPLHALGLFVSRLAQLPHGPEVQPLVSHIDESVQALQDLLDTLLDVSRLDAGLVTAKPTDFPIGDLLSRLALESGGPAEEKGVSLRIRPSKLWLRTDPGLLMRIIMNFVANALRYTSHGGVLVACRRRGGNARLEVWDTGIGIPREHLDTVFCEYIQLANPERNKAKGLGLGLAICDKLAKLLGLRIGVRSVPGRGSVFWVDVPLGRAQEAGTPDPASSMPNIRIEGTVVVLEDVASSAASMVGLVSGWGCQVIGAASAAEAIALCEAAGKTPDMVIAEYRLQENGDGLAAGVVLRERFRHPPLLLIGADVDDRLIGKAADLGFTLLIKPVRPGKLRAIVQQMLAPSRATIESD
jgi:signal transduction histidine kinase